MIDPDLRTELTGAVDEAFGETVLHHPLASGGVDPERPVSSLVVVLRTGARSDALGRSREKEVRIGVNASGGYLRIDRALYPDLIVRAGDKIRAMERTGQPWFEILSVDDRSHLRLTLDLGDA